MLTSQNGFKVNSEYGTAETSDVEGTRFTTMPQVRVGVIGRAMRLIGNHTHFRVTQE